MKATFLPTFSIALESAALSNPYYYLACHCCISRSDGAGCFLFETAFICYSTPGAALFYGTAAFLPGFFSLLL